jgi:hypothetical protein
MFGMNSKLSTDAVVTMRNITLSDNLGRARVA